MNTVIMLGIVTIMIILMFTYLIGSLIVAYFNHDKAMKRIDEEAKLFKSGVEKIVNGDKNSMTEEEIEAVATLAPNMLL